jgi:hypothetical protein
MEPLYPETVPGGGKKKEIKKESIPPGIMRRKWQGIIH